MKFRIYEGKLFTKSPMDAPFWSPEGGAHVSGTHLFTMVTDCEGRLTELEMRTGLGCSAQLEVPVTDGWYEVQFKKEDGPGTFFYITEQKVVQAEPDQLPFYLDTRAGIRAAHAARPFKRLSIKHPYATPLLRAVLRSGEWLNKHGVLGLFGQSHEPGTLGDAARHLVG